MLEEYLWHSFLSPALYSIGISGAYAFIGTSKYTGIPLVHRTFQKSQNNVSYNRKTTGQVRKKMKRFSQRKGFKPVDETIQIKGMSEELRNTLWNVLDVLLWSTDDYIWMRYGTPPIVPFTKSLWIRYFKKPIDTIPTNNADKLNKIRDYFFSCEWFEIYDFLEFVIGCHEKLKNELTHYLNNVLESELSGYRFIDGNAVDITDKQEIQMLKEVLSDTKFEGVNAHFKRALELLSDRKKPDYRNSIKESISAVESMTKIITNKPKSTLGDALIVLEKRGEIHTALKKGFAALYGFTSDEGGVRHAMLEEPNLSALVENCVDRYRLI